MSSFDYQRSTITKYRTGTSEDPFIPVTETKKVINGQILLNEIPVFTNKVKIENMFEVPNSDTDELQEGEYRVDYLEGILFFHPTSEGSAYTISYMGRGNHYLSAARIWTQENEGEVVETLKDIILTGTEAIQNIEELDALMHLAEGTVVEARQAIDEATVQSGLANEKANYAEQQGNYAKEQGNYAKEQGDHAKSEAASVNEKGLYAESQGDYAKEQAESAKIAAQQANTAASEITRAILESNQAVNDAVAATESANEAANAANTAAELVESKVAYAESQGNYAKEQGDAAKNILPQIAEKMEHATIAATNANEAASRAETASVNAENQVSYAQKQGDYAKQQADSVQSIAESAQVATGSANIATENAVIATEKAINAASTAESATTEANDAAIQARDQAGYAQTQGNYAKDQADEARVHASFAQTQGNYAKNQGNYAKEQAEIALLKGTSLINRGIFDDLLTYKPLNIVVYNSGVYQNIQESVGIPPTNPEYWQMLMQTSASMTWDSIFGKPDIDGHLINNHNPHGVTAEQVGAYSKESVDDKLSSKQDLIGYIPENSANKGMPGGYAGLDADGKIPETQLNLPSNIETTDGAQGKADLAENNAKSYVDESINKIDFSQYDERGEAAYSHAEGYKTKADSQASHVEGQGAKVSIVASSNMPPLVALNNKDLLGEEEIVVESGHAEGFDTLVTGAAGHAEGLGSRAEGIASHAEGYYTTAFGLFSHTEGGGTLTLPVDILFLVSDINEENKTITIQSLYKIQGGGGPRRSNKSSSSGFNIGDEVVIVCDNENPLIYDIIADIDETNQIITLTNNIPNNTYKYICTLNIDFPLSAHAEGIRTEALGQGSHSEGDGSIALGNASHAEGNWTAAIGEASHAEGAGTVALEEASHAEGRYTQAFGEASHAEGEYTKAFSDAAHAEGSVTLAIGSRFFSRIASFDYSLRSITVENTTSLYEGKEIMIIGRYFEIYNDTIAEVISDTKVILSTLTPDESWMYIFSPDDNSAAHAEGSNTIAAGVYTHAEGIDTVASGEAAHAEGGRSEALGDYSHAEGFVTTASGEASHAEGSNTSACTKNAHAEGENTIALNGLNSSILSWDDTKNTVVVDEITTSISDPLSGITTNLGFVVGDQVLIRLSNNEVPIYDIIKAIDTESKTITLGEAPNSFYKNIMKKTSEASEAYPVHAEGFNTLATGITSHSEGWLTTATGHFSHAEGKGTLSIGVASHAEGLETTSLGFFSHAEGIYTLAANGDSAFNILRFDADKRTVTLNNASELYKGTKVIIKINNSLSLRDTISSVNGNIITLQNHVPNNSWRYIIKEGTGQYPSHAEGTDTTACGRSSHAEGINTIASGQASHAEGNATKATGGYSHAEGSSTEASGEYSHAEGLGTDTSGKRYSHIMGSFGDASENGSWNLANGINAGERGLAAKILSSGQVYADGAFNSTGADYSELFEWMDGNIDDDDRVGYFVTLDGDKIRKATSQDLYILGVVSATPNIIGDSAGLRWNGKYMTDEWGRIRYHFVTIPEVTEKERVEWQPMINPEWNNEEPYVERITRPEWSAIGLIGKLLVRDDGSCQVNGYCRSNEGGIATNSEDGFRVMKRISPNIIQVLMR